MQPQNKECQCLLSSLHYILCLAILTSSYKVNADLMGPIYAEYIMRNAGLEETQAGIKIAGTLTSKSIFFILNLTLASILPGVQY